MITIALKSTTKAMTTAKIPAIIIALEIFIVNNADADLKLLVISFSRKFK